MFDRRWRSFFFVDENFFSLEGREKTNVSCHYRMCGTTFLGHKGFAFSFFSDPDESPLPADRQYINPDHNHRSDQRRGGDVLRK